MHLLQLPNEILFQVLREFGTLCLLKLRCVNQTFQQVTTRIVHRRLLLATSLDDRKLILECYHPSAQYSEPYLYCDYIGSPELKIESRGQGHNDSLVECYKTGLLRRLYCRFRPTDKDPQFGGQRTYLASDIAGSRTSEAAAATLARATSRDRPVQRLVSLEAHENFSQLVCNTELVKLGPRRGMFLDIMRVTEKKTFRLFRQWLIHRAEHCMQRRDETSTGQGEAATDHDLFWIDEHQKSVGLRLRVEEREWRREDPVLLHQDEDPAVTFLLELHEVHISTLQLLLAIEQNILDKERSSGQAMVFTTAQMSP